MTGLDGDGLDGGGQLRASRGIGQPGGQTRRGVLAELFHGAVTVDTQPQSEFQCMQEHHRVFVVELFGQRRRPRRVAFGGTQVARREPSRSPFAQPRGVVERTTGVGGDGCFGEGQVGLGLVIMGALEHHVLPRLSLIHI